MGDSPAKETFFGQPCLFCGEVIRADDQRSYEVWIYGVKGGVGQRAHPECLESAAHEGAHFRELFSDRR